MKIEVTHVITADPQLISLAGAILAALGKPTENLSVKDSIEPASKGNVANVESGENSKATKRTYLLHEESGALIVVNKGEELAERLEQGLVEITKAEYDRIQSEKQARIDKAKQDAENESAVENSQGDTNSKETADHGITIEMVRAEAKKLTSNGRQAEFKNILNSFDAPKLTAVPEEKYPDLLAAIKEAVGEE